MSAADNIPGPKVTNLTISNSENCNRYLPVGLIDKSPKTKKAPSDVLLRSAMTISATVLTSIFKVLKPMLRRHCSPAEVFRRFLSVFRFVKEAAAHEIIWVVQEVPVTLSG